MNLIDFYRFARFFYLKKIFFLSKATYYVQFLIFNSSIPYKTIIGKGSRFAYGGIGVVIHERAVIGENCVIGQNVTIGGKSKKNKVPVVGNNVYIGAGSRLLGPINIGDNVIIGANSVVIDNVPSNVIVAGVPAKVIKQDIIFSDYI